MLAHRAAPWYPCGKLLQRSLGPWSLFCRQDQGSGEQGAKDLPPWLRSPNDELQPVSRAIRERSCLQGSKPRSTSLGVRATCRSATREAGDEGISKFSPKCRRRLGRGIFRATTTTAAAAVLVKSARLVQCPPETRSWMFGCGVVLVWRFDILKHVMA